MQKKYLLFFSLILFGLLAFPKGGLALTADSPSISYSAHVQDIGWMNPVSDGTTAGTTGQSKRMEAIKLSIQNGQGLGVQYSADVQGLGWMNPVSDGTTAGTTGQSKRMEAIKIALTGTEAANYDVYYRVHVEHYGWLDWAKNGETAGTQGYGLRIEAIQVELVAKGGQAPGSTEQPFMLKPPSVDYSAHVQDIGWMNPVSDGTMAGTTGQAKRMEAIKLSIQNGQDLGVQYATDVQGLGWMNTVSDGQVGGTTGQGRQMEAIKISLTGTEAANYDIYYRVHVEHYGWLDWTKNGEPAGTQGYGLRIEAIQVELVAKGGSAPGSTGQPFILKPPSVDYSAHVQDIGWMPFVADGTMAGTTGQSKRLEAIKIQLQDSPYAGDITYSTQVQDDGWLNSVSDGQTGGTTGQSKMMEAININLTGDIANYYDVYYRAYVQHYGWLGWAKDGMNAGTQGLALRMEAIQIKLVPKGQGDPVSTTNAFRTLKTTSYNISLDDFIKDQLSVGPQTDKYRNDPAYVPSSYVNVEHSAIISGYGVNLRTSPDFPAANDNVAFNVPFGTKITILSQVQGASYAGSTTWDKILYHDNASNTDNTLYVHSSLVNPGATIYTLNSRANILQSTDPNSLVFGTLPSGTVLSVTNEVDGATVNGSNKWDQVQLGAWRNASYNDVAQYADPTKQDQYEFLVLSGTAGLSASDLNILLSNKGILNGTGQSFKDASDASNVNEIYLVAHALLETGNGTSTLANGVYVDQNGNTIRDSNGNLILDPSLVPSGAVKVYNMFGIAAFDSNPTDGAARKAFEMGWTSVDKAIKGGAQWISDNYINNSNYDQNTLYKMRWNPASPGTHEYATDVGWAAKQVDNFDMKDLYAQLPNANQYFDIPVFK